MGHPSTDDVYADASHELIITEKLDGNNFRFTYDFDEEALRFGSRNVDLGTDVDEIGGQFEDVTDYIDEHVDRKSVENVRLTYDSNFVVFGENLGFDHLIDDYVDDTPTYQVFDVFIVDDERWLPRDQVLDVAAELDLRVAPVVDRFPADEFDHTEYEIEPSVWRPGEQPPEGVVVENQQTMARGKIITEEYAELKGSGYGGDGQSTEDLDNTHAFVETYFTEARIKKQVHKMVNEEGRDLSMELMEDLHKRVWEDGWEEEWRVMIYEDMDINLKEGHKKCANKCAAVLQEMIRNRDQST